MGSVNDEKRGGRLKCLKGAAVERVMGGLNVKKRGGGVFEGMISGCNAGEGRGG